MATPPPGSTQGPKGSRRSELQQRLDKLIRLRTETASLFQKLDSDLESNYQKYEQTTGLADAAATVANIVAGLSFLVVKGMSTLQLTGAALKEANKKLGKDAIHFAIDPVKDVGIKVAADKLDGGAGFGWALLKTALRSWVDINSPSFWAGVVGNLEDGKSWSNAVNTNPKDILLQEKTRIEYQRDETLNALDRKIQNLRLELNRG